MLLIYICSSFTCQHVLFQPVKVQIKFAKYILGVNKTAPNLAVPGELGMIPCSVDAIKLCVGFWHHVVNSNPDSVINKICLSSHKIKSRYLLQILDICTFGQVVFQKP